MTASPLLGVRSATLNPTTPTTPTNPSTPTPSVPSGDGLGGDPLDGPSSDARLPGSPLGQGDAGRLSSGVGTLASDQRSGGRVPASVVLGTRLQSRLDPERSDALNQSLDARVREIEERIYTTDAERYEPGQDAYRDVLQQIRESRQTRNPRGPNRNVPLNGENPDPERTGGGDNSPLWTPGAQGEIAPERVREMEAARREAVRKAFGLDPEQPGEGGAADEVIEGLRTDLPRLGTLAGEKESQYNRLMAQAEANMGRGDHRSAADDYARAVRVSPDQPLARIGQAHAQLGFGMILSSALNLRAAMLEHPELIPLRYTDALLPNATRLQERQEDLLEMIRRGTHTEDAGLMLAYIGHQIESRQTVRFGLAAAETADPKDPLLPVLRKLWLEEPQAAGDAAETTEEPTPAPDPAPLPDPDPAPAPEPEPEPRPTPPPAEETPLDLDLDMLD